jgi:hypothetical protein
MFHRSVRREIVPPHREGGKPTGSEDEESRVQVLCREVLSADAAAIAVQSTEDQPLSPAEAASKAAAQARRTVAFRTLRTCRSEGFADISAKFDLLFVLERRFGDDAPEIARFALQIAREAYPFLMETAGNNRVSARHSGRALNRARPLWLERLPKLF